MASINLLSKEFIDVAREGIGFIVLWKEGRSWNGITTYDISYENTAGIYKVNPLMVGELEAILDKDPRAIAVCSYYDNIGGIGDELTQAKLADGLRYQYEKAPGSLEAILSEITAECEQEAVEEIEQVVEQSERTVEEQATEQLPATRSSEPEVRVKKPTLIDEMARKAAKAEVEAAKEVIKEPEQAVEQVVEQAVEQAAEPRRAVDWKEVMETTKQAVGRLCEAGKKLTAAVAPKAKLAGAATAMLLMDLLAILIPIICDVAVAIAGCAWGFATDILPEWARHTAAPAATKAYKAVAREGAKVYKVAASKAVKDYHDAVNNLTRAYRAVVTAAAIMAYMMRIVLA